MGSPWLCSLGSEVEVQMDVGALQAGASVHNPHQATSLRISYHQLINCPRCS